MLNDTTPHYLVGRYITHQPDGVHIEALCTRTPRSRLAESPGAGSSEGGYCRS